MGASSQSQAGELQEHCSNNACQCNVKVIQPAVFDTTQPMSMSKSTSMSHLDLMYTYKYHSIASCGMYMHMHVVGDLFSISEQIKTSVTIGT